MKFELDIKSVTVIISSSADTIIYEFNNIQNGCWPYEGCQSFKHEVAKGSAEVWLETNFGKEILKITKKIDTTVKSD